MVRIVANEDGTAHVQIAVVGGPAVASAAEEAAAEGAAALAAEEEAAAATKGAAAAAEGAAAAADGEAPEAAAAVATCEGQVVGYVIFGFDVDVESLATCFDLGAVRTSSPSR